MFTSEFISLKTAEEMVEGLRYKLCMLGVPMEGATHVFCNNESVVKNSSRPESTLKKCHNAIAYHRCHEVQVAGDYKWIASDPSILVPILTYGLAIWNRLSHHVTATL
jgi:hypothetical protein